MVIRTKPNVHVDSNKYSDTSAHVALAPRTPISQSVSRESTPPDEADDATNRSESEVGTSAYISPKTNGVPITPGNTAESSPENLNDTGNVGYTPAREPIDEAEENASVVTVEIKEGSVVDVRSETDEAPTAREDIAVSSREGLDCAGNAENMPARVAGEAAWTDATSEGKGGGMTQEEADHQACTDLMEARVKKQAIISGKGKSSPRGVQMLGTDSNSVGSLHWRKNLS